MYTLGVSTMTESAAVLMRDGTTIAAAEEERFSRVKHDGGIPYRAVQYVLSAENLRLADIDCLAIYWNPYALAHRAKYLASTVWHAPSLLAERVRRSANVFRGTGPRDSGWLSLFSVERKLARHFGSAPRRTLYLDHHECHMASCHYGSPYDSNAILIMDGAGESACTTWGIGEGTQMRKIDEHLLPHSLGHYYSAITGYLGFKMLDGEYKLMGLSPYGDPAGSRWIRENFLVSTSRGRYALRSGVLDYHRALRGLFPGTFRARFGPERPQSESVPFEDRHRDIAASAQRAFEQVVLDMARELSRATRQRTLAIAGGCGLNCVANGRILREGYFESIYVPPVPNDSGGALGAAMLAYARITGRRPEPVNHAQLGPQITAQDAERALRDATDLRVERPGEDALLERTAQLLASGGVVSWVSGRMEFGARALGNRSFLADARTDGIRDVLNEKIKKRELFRPFAPSVKAESAEEYFELKQDSPFMTIVVPVRPAARARIPAVTHVDGTARPQTVSRDANPRYWALLDRFERITGVPVLLNTSFNIQEPIVCTAEEAVRTFRGSKVDALVLENRWVTRQQQ